MNTGGFSFSPFGSNSWQQDVAVDTGNKPNQNNSNESNNNFGGINTGFSFGKSTIDYNNDNDNTNMNKHSNNQNFGMNFANNNEMKVDNFGFNNNVSKQKISKKVNNATKSIFKYPQIHWSFGNCAHFVTCSKRITHIQWEIPPNYQISLMRKLSEIVNDTQMSLEQNDADMDGKVAIILDSSDYTLTKMEEYLSKCYENSNNNRNNNDNNDMNSESDELDKYVSLMTNALSIWKFCHLFWFMNETRLSTAVASIKFVLSFQEWLEQTFHITEIIENEMKTAEAGNDKYWYLIKRLVLIGNFEKAFGYLKYDRYLTENSHILDEIKKLFEESPFVLLAYKGQAFNDMDFRNWKQKVDRASRRYRDNLPNLYCILRIMCGDENEMQMICQNDNKWLEWLNGYLMFTNPWVDTRVELAIILGKRRFPQQQDGSWIYRVILNREYVTVFDVCNSLFPTWFTTHLCYFLASLHETEMIIWPRKEEIMSMKNELIENSEMTLNQFNKLTEIEKENELFDIYLSLHVMHRIEWIFEYYCENMIDKCYKSAWQWLPNYLQYFLRRGYVLYEKCLDYCDIMNDNHANKLLQYCQKFVTCENKTEFEENENDSETIPVLSNMYDQICLKMAQKSFMKLQFGRVTYWCLRCKYTNNNNDGNNNNNMSSLANSMINKFSYYIEFIIKGFLNNPIDLQWYEYMSDVYDNIDLKNEQLLNDVPLLRLLICLIDMYHARLDLQNEKESFESKVKQFVKMINGNGNGNNDSILSNGGSPGFFNNKNVNNNNNNNNTPKESIFAVISQELRMKQKQDDKQESKTNYPQFTSFFTRNDIDLDNMENIDENGNIFDKNTNEFVVTPMHNRNSNKNNNNNNDDSNIQSRNRRHLLGSGKSDDNEMAFLPTPLRKSQRKSRRASQTYEQILLSTQKTEKKQRSRLSKQEENMTNDENMGNENKDENIRLFSEKKVRRKRYDYIEPPSLVKEDRLFDNDNNGLKINFGSHDASFNMNENNGNNNIINNNDEYNKLMQEYEYKSCSHIIAFISNFCDIIQFNLYLRSEYFIPILKFTLPVLKNEFACQAISMEQILSMTHEWYEIKFIGNKTKRYQFGRYNNNNNNKKDENNDKSGMNKLTNEELKEIAKIFVDLQTKILTSTYDNKNYVAQILKYKQSIKTNKYQVNNNDDMIDID